MILLVFVVSGPIATTHAERDPVTGFCRRFGHQATVIDRKLYIDGGSITYDPLTSDPTNYTREVVTDTFLSYLMSDHPPPTPSAPSATARASERRSVGKVSLYMNELSSLTNLFLIAQWSNTTETDVGIRRAEGAMVYPLVSDNSMLVYFFFGGIRDSGKVHLYNMGTSKWYVQHASSDVLDMRRRFCAEATWAYDQSSYNISLYGGLGFVWFPPNNEAGFDDVYILSLPSFTWTKMYLAPGTHGLDMGEEDSEANLQVL
ncbi:hypothetical protein PG993_001749 [Apiospora rasikravindrae]|uniref:Uncharacterized protein n=1 Tax=Apiospora rasikravindrae TaxID=990691 RepID=A0ABR1UCB5_9PEZI